MKKVTAWIETDDVLQNYSTFSPFTQTGLCNVLQIIRTSASLMWAMGEWIWELPLWQNLSLKNRPSRSGCCMKYFFFPLHFYRAVVLSLSVRSKALQNIPNHIPQWIREGSRDCQWKLSSWIWNEMQAFTYISKIPPHDKGYNTQHVITLFLVSSASWIY